MVSKPDATRAYFDKIPGQWDALYLHENRTKYFFNKIFRRALFERHRLTFEQCGDITGATVLDIGCGTGRFSIEFAARGASRVVGIDFSAAMIEYAHTLAQDHNVGDRCYFVRDDFLSHEFGQRFRIVVAMGFFDYMSDPGPVIKKIASLTAGVFLASFPRQSIVWGLQRSIRYRLIKRCPVYNYTRDQLNSLFPSGLFADVRILETSHGFFAVAWNRQSD